MKRTVILLICAAVLLTLLPMSVLGATVITGSGVNFFAGGIPVTIQATAPADGTEEVPAGFTATGTSAYIVWDDGGTVKYCGVAATTVVYGGADGRTAPVTVASTSVSMTGGKIFRIYGGNWGQDATNPGETNPLTAASAVTGNVDINVTGGEGLDIICGGGKHNTSVGGKVTINITDVDTLGNGCYVMGGVHGNGKEGYVDSASQEIVTNAVVNSVEINYVNAKADPWDMICAGGGGNTKVNTAKIVLGDGEGTADTVADIVLASGVNGSVGDVEITVNSDVSIPIELSAVNRGYVNDGTVNIDGADIETIYTGAKPNCFSSDTPANGGVSATGGMTFNVTDASGIDKLVMTPNVNVQNGVVESNLGNLTINNSDAENPLAVTTEVFDSGSATLPDIDTLQNAADDSLVIGENVELTVADTVSLENKGSIVIDGKLTANGPVAIVGDGELLNNGEIENNSEISLEDNASMTNAGTINNAETAGMPIAEGAELLNASGSTITGKAPEAEGGKIKYYAAISGGSGSGYYEEGAPVSIAFDNANDTLKFDGWTLPSDLEPTEGGVDTETLTFTMPMHEVSILAEHINKTAPTENTGSIPATGDPVFLAVVLLAASAAGLIVVAKRREA